MNNNDITFLMNNGNIDILDIRGNVVEGKFLDGSGSVGEILK